MNKAQEPVLSIDNISKHFTEAGNRVDVLQDVNLLIGSSEMLAITGASGSGKSTLLHILAGLEIPDAGNVRLMGHAFSQESDQTKTKLRNKHMGFIYQFHHLLPEFNVLENIMMPLLIKRVARQDATEQAHAMLQAVNLENRHYFKVTDISGGERQRVAIARALVTQPQIVLADEPTGNLDAKTADSIIDLMASLNESSHTSYIIVTHNEALANRMDRHLQLVGGRLSD